MGSHCIVAETVISISITKKTYITIPYPTHHIKTQPIQLGVVLKVHVRVFNCQGRRVSTSDPAQEFFFSEFARVCFFCERFSNIL